MRKQFGGVRFGKNYVPTFALVESEENYVIVKINDVGPLKPGRVIDLNERSMRYLNVTPLPGEDWTPGPIGSERQISLATVQ